MAKKKKRNKIKYSKTFERFYKENKRKIIEGLEGDVPKNQIKKIFYLSVKERQYYNPGMSQKTALKSTLLTSTFSSEEERFDYYKETVFNNVFKGVKQEVKRYLGMGYRDKLDIKNFERTSEGWVYKYNGKNVAFLRNADTKTEGYNILYE